MKHKLTKDQARRLGVRRQIVTVTLKEEHEKHPDNKTTRIAKDIFNSSGNRLGGTLSLDE